MFIGEVVISFLLVLALFSVLGPSQLTMPSSITLMLIVLSILAFLIYIGVIWKERAVDEREELHVLRAGRNSFLVGMSVLMTGVIFQSFNHVLDPWIVVAMIAMVLTKVLFRVYQQIYH